MILVLGLMINLVCIIYIAFKVEDDTETMGIWNLAASNFSTVPPNILLVTNIWIAGMVFDGTTIQTKIWKALVDLNCNHNVGVHIIVKSDFENLKRHRDELTSDNMSCAPFIILEEKNLALGNDP